VGRGPYVAKELCCFQLPSSYMLGLSFFRNVRKITAVYFFLGILSGRLCGLWSEFLATERRCNMFPVRYKLNLYVM
jgi:hypothetical protein